MSAASKGSYNLKAHINSAKHTHKIPDLSYKVSEFLLNEIQKQKNKQQQLKEHCLFIQ